MKNDNSLLTDKIHWPITRPVSFRNTYQPECLDPTSLTTFHVHRSVSMFTLYEGRVTNQERGVRLVILHILPETFIFWNRKYPPEHQRVAFPYEEFLLVTTILLTWALTCWCCWWPLACITNRAWRYWGTLLIWAGVCHYCSTQLARLWICHWIRYSWGLSITSLTWWLCSRLC